ncbi:AraC family transcriptional regulator [Persicitalea jodogahamensis]|uniref:AraC family transcriptional regulator n=1 Tax=Persicitalea jodogahamensis TaxID=402147 RepID=UPI0016795AAC|nr:AraC family transcriptional regulator [Persicitalea jodogahamensis]
MNQNHSPESLHVENLNLDKWTQPVHSTGHHSIVLIQHGEGYLTINQTQFRFRPGDVFLPGLRDQYSFRFTQHCDFYWLSFSSSFVENLLTTETQTWNFINQPDLTCSGSIATNATDQKNLLALAAILLSEKRSLRSLTHSPIVDSLMKTFLSMIDRLHSQREPAAMDRHSYPSAITRRVIAHICRHIHEPDLLKMETIANEFNYSSGHLSALFRQQVGDSIQQFIIKYRLKMVARKLRHSTLTVSQIADEFGFSDVCHLNKHFKRHYNHTPTVHRQIILP